MGGGDTVSGAAPASEAGPRLYRSLPLDVFGQLVIRCLYSYQVRILSAHVATEHSAIVDTLFCRWANVESAEKRRPRRDIRLHGAGVAKSGFRSWVSAGLLVRIAAHDSGSGDDPAVSFLKRAFAV